VFEWDPRKAEANAAKHGVSFDDAVTVFLGSLVFVASSWHRARVTAEIQPFETGTARSASPRTYPVSQPLASWNRIGVWLRQLDGIRRAA